MHFSIIIIINKSHENNKTNNKFTLIDKKVLSV